MMTANLGYGRLVYLREYDIHKLVYTAESVYMLYLA